MTRKDRNSPPPLAVALRYDGSSAPVVTAKGQGFVAEEILRLAREHEIPIRDEPDLVRVLSKIRLGDEIPRSLYVAVAQVIAFAYALKGKSPQAESTHKTAGDRGELRLNAPD